MLHGAHRVADDAPELCGAGAVQESIAEAFRAFADRGVDLALLVALRPCRDQAERDRCLPVLVDTVDEGLRVGAAVVLGEVVREPAILQVRLIAG